MSKKRHILNIFPKPVNLTEISILSIYEVILYLALFYFFYYVYTAWTFIPTKTIEMTCDRIDNHNLYFYHYEFDSISSKSTKVYDKNKPVKSCYAFHVYIPNSMVNMEPSHYNEHWFSRPFINNWTSDDNSVFRLLRNERNYGHILDSLFGVFNYRYRFLLDSLKYKKQKIDSIIKNDSIPVFYQNILFYQNTKRKSHLFDEQIDELKYLEGHNRFITFNINNIKNNEIGYLTTNLESFLHEKIEYTMSELDGVFAKPGKFDLYDISQCYYKFIFRSHTIDTTYLYIHFYGANDFSFVETKPSDIDCQTIEYKLTALGSVDQSVIIHVKSKELAVLQSSRLFFITAILSGLIVIFLTFTVIFLYRLLSWGKEKIHFNKKINKERKDKVLTQCKENKADIIDPLALKDKLNKDESYTEEQVEHAPCEEESVNNKPEKDDDKSLDNNEKSSSKIEKT